MFLICQIHKTFLWCLIFAANIPRLVSEPVDINERENGKNQSGDGDFLIKQGEGDASGQTTILHGSQKYKKINFVFLSVKIESYFPDEEIKNERAGKGYASDHDKFCRQIHEENSAVGRYGVKNYKIAVIERRIFMFFDKMIPFFFNSQP